MTQIRERKEGACPRCGADLVWVEESLETEENGIIGWTPTRRYCSAGCLLTVADFPEGS